MQAVTKVKQGYMYSYHKSYTTQMSNCSIGHPVAVTPSTLHSVGLLIYMYILCDIVQWLQGIITMSLSVPSTSNLHLLSLVDLRQGPVHEKHTQLPCPWRVLFAISFEVVRVVTVSYGKHQESLNAHAITHLLFISGNCKFRQLSVRYMHTLSYPGRVLHFLHVGGS